MRASIFAIVLGPSDRALQNFLATECALSVSRHLNSWNPYLPRSMLITMRLPPSPDSSDSLIKEPLPSLEELSKSPATVALRTRVLANCLLPIFTLIACCSSSSVLGLFLRSFSILALSSSLVNLGLKAPALEEEPASQGLLEATGLEPGESEGL